MKFSKNINKRIKKEMKLPLHSLLNSLIRASAVSGFSDRDGQWGKKIVSISGYDVRAEAGKQPSRSPLLPSVSEIS